MHHMFVECSGWRISPFSGVQFTEIHGNKLRTEKALVTLVCALKSSDNHHCAGAPRIPRLARRDGSIGQRMTSGYQNNIQLLLLSHLLLFLRLLAVDAFRI